MFSISNQSELGRGLVNDRPVIGARWHDLEAREIGTSRLPTESKGVNSAQITGRKKGNYLGMLLETGEVRDPSCTREAGDSSFFC